MVWWWYLGVIWGSFGAILGRSGRILGKLWVDGCASGGDTCAAHATI